MTNHQATYDWAMPIENRFQLMSHTGAMQYYGDKDRRYLSEGTGIFRCLCWILGRHAGNGCQSKAEQQSSFFATISKHNRCGVKSEQGPWAIDKTSQRWWWPSANWIQKFGGCSRSLVGAGKRPINKHTFAEHELSPHTNQYPQKNIGNLSKFFTADEGLRWLEFSRNNTPIETALRTRSFTARTVENYYISKAIGTIRCNYVQRIEANRTAAVWC